ncbi:MAG: AAA family ATPase [Acidobacteriota bacterium]|nr:AAA family ATPase [Acidobacteriota bacterium]
MHLRRLEVHNFRAITKFSHDLTSGANILVGPNAVGKTTILEAIRLNKAVLAPRTQQEGRSVLVSLGVSSNAIPQILNFSAIANDSSQRIIINCDYQLSEEELSRLPSLAEELSRGLAAAQAGIPIGDNGQPQAIQFFASPMGSSALTNARKYVQENIVRVSAEGLCKLHLEVRPQNCEFRGNDSFSQILFSIIESQLSPYKTLFSHFSADRAMPFGDPPIQLGAIDAQQQLESYNSNPMLKFQRFKNTIFSSLIESTESKNQQDRAFNLIFTELLKEREIADYNVNRFGQAEILIKDTRTDRKFDIDSLSSGEKGLILTFLILSKSIERGGIVLIDEPEIHLNPAVCKDLLPFMVVNYLTPLNIQAVICTHSAEILGAAMRMDNCRVLHMRQGGAVSLIRQQDQPEVAQALKLLGTSEVEEMLYEAVVFVEGPDDVEILETAFPKLLSRIKFRELSGRGEIEKSIKNLQAAEIRGEKENISYFLFDRDRKPTDLKSSDKVILRQWDRYCLENYLIEPEVLYDYLKVNYDFPKIPRNLGEAVEQFSRIAKNQLTELVMMEVYSEFGYDGPGMREKDRTGKSFEDAAAALYLRIDNVRTQLASIEEGIWKNDFVGRCKAKLQQRELEWSTSWIAKCDGKRFIQDLYREYPLGIKAERLKRALLKENMLANGGAGTESWKLLVTKFNDLMQDLNP